MKKNIFIVYSMVGALLITVAIWLLSLQLNVTLGPDLGASWYEWKLPNPTWVTRFSAWSMYFVHLILVWILLYKLKKEKPAKKGALNKYNKWLLIVNGVFVFLHFIQTYIWYDGIAQDVPIFTSQGSVIVMLVLILIMESKRRGLLFGKKVPIPTTGWKRIMKYHGFFISWAIIYTFWYHPMEGTSGHLFGFFYMLLLIVQMSLGKTKYHNNRIWTFILEVTVLFHGTAVAIMQQNDMWPMFFFGFAFIFVATQIYGLGLPKYVIMASTIAYFVFAILVYSGILFGIRTIGEIHQILWIPIIEYLLVFVIVYPLSLFPKKKIEG